MQQRIAGIAAATFLLVGGGIHLNLWRGGYRAIEYIGPLFVANVAISAVLVLAVLIRPDVRVAVAALLFSAGSIAALVLSRTTGLLGFTERAWTDMAVQATSAEFGAVVALALMLVVRHRATPQLRTAAVRSGR